MLNRFDVNVKATIAFLKLLNVKVTNATVDETLQNHPDWPSLLCISDSLKKWNVPNAGGKIEVKDIEQLPTPFLAYTSSVESPLEIVTEIQEKEVMIYSIKDKKIKSELIENFAKRWSGVYLIAEKTEASGEKEFRINRRNSFIKSLIPISLLLLTTVVSLVFLQQQIEVSIIQNTIPIYFQFFILFMGIIVSTLLLLYEIDNNNPLLHKVCTGIAKGNCDAILSSKQSKLFSWLSWSEVGFFFYSGALSTLLFTDSIKQSLFIIGSLSVLSLPYTLFSIYYQARVAKQWCVLCLTIQILIVLGGINTLLNDFLTNIGYLELFGVIKSIVLYLILALLWYTIKPYLKKLQEAKTTKREYSRIKFNPEIFETLLKVQKQITISTNGIGIDFGNPNATNILVKVCNPYCSPCSKAHPKIEKLLDVIPNLKVKIIFTIPNEPENEAYKPVAHLLKIASQNENAIRQALDDWYLIDEKNYDVFAMKYPLNESLEKQGVKVNAMYDWCEKMNISFTPTIFINGQQMPEVYNIDDLQYFLLQ